MYGCIFMRLGKIISFFLACIIFSTSFIAIPVTSEETVMTLQEEIIISVDSTNLRFSPAEVTIVEGQTVIFFWDGELLEHNAVEMNGFFDSGEPGRNVDYSFTFDVGTNGVYEFVCEPHELANMVGKITVNQAPPVDVIEDDEDGVKSESESLVDSFCLTFLLAIFGAIVILLTYGIRKMRKV
jgi:plastocyanin